MALPLVWLGDVLRAAGLRVVETPGWKTRTATGTQPRPVGVLEHHTATPTSYQRPAPTVQLCIDGRPDLDGPLCHVVIGYDGTVHLIAAGRANHAGKAKASGPNPAGDGNTLYVGFEWDYQGMNQGPSPEQYNAAMRGTAAVLLWLDRPAEAARGHKETSVTGKIDPGRVDMNAFRADVAWVMAGGKSAATPGGIETLAFNDTFTTRYGNQLSVADFMAWMDFRVNELYRAVLEPGSQPSRIPGDKNTTNLRDAVMDSTAWSNITMREVVALKATVAALGGVAPSAVAEALRPVLAEIIGPVVQESVTAALGEDNAEQAEAIVDELAQRLAGGAAA